MLHRLECVKCGGVVFSTSPHETLCFECYELENGLPAFRDFSDELRGLKEQSAPQAETTHKIIVGDCRDTLRQISDRSVHLIVTSPPYNCNIGYGKHNDNMSFRNYLKFTSEWLQECYRVLVDGGRVCINLPAFIHRNFQGNILIYPIHRIMREIGFFDRELIVWVKSDGNGDFICKKDFYGTFCSPKNPKLNSAYEVVVVMNKASRYLSGEQSDITETEFKQWSYNVWHIRPEADRSHPAPYPEELPRRLIKLYTYAGQTVLDPFLGSGTTMKVAHECGRNSIGCELDNRYVDMALDRAGFGVEIVRRHRGIEVYV